MGLRKILFLIAFFVAFSLALSCYVYYSSVTGQAYEAALAEIERNARDVARRLSYLAGQDLQTAATLSELPPIRNALQGDSISGLSEVNRLLDIFQRSFGASVCYLMDRTGLTVASSNRHDDDTFVGSNYSFRPYFQEAAKGNPCVHLARGVTSGRRGVYYGHPVRGEGGDDVLGVVVVKLSIGEIERQLDHVEGMVCSLVSPHGIVFSTNRRPWLFGAMSPLSDSERENIAGLKQFGGGAWEWIGLNFESGNSAISEDGRRYIVHRETLRAFPGWQLVVLKDVEMVREEALAPVFRPTTLVLLLVCLCVAVSSTLLYLRASDEIRRREETEKALKTANESNEEQNAKLMTVNAELNNAIERANRLVEETDIANRLKSEFIANMSHEVRTPLNGVIGMASMLMNTELTFEQSEFASSILSSANCLLVIVNDILDISKIEAGKLEMETLDFDLRVSLEQTVKTLSFRAQEKGLEFDFEIEPDTPSLLRGDPGRLRQVFMNLAGNAVKFTPAGKIRIRIGLDKETEASAFLRFTFQDTGIGVPESLKSRVFEPFTQADASVTRKYGGIGLGLNISKKLVERMGGDIGVESREGQGATFWFTAELEKQVPKKYVDSSVCDSISGKKVMVADANRTDRNYLVALLSSWGCRHETAVTVDEALDRLRASAEQKDPFHIAVMNIPMPGMDAEEFGQAVSQDPSIASIFLVAMTSEGRRGDAKRLKQAGFKAFLSKPVSHSLLFDCLNAVLSFPDEVRDADDQYFITKYDIAEERKQRVRILVVEDNAVNQRVALKIIGKFGYSVEVAQNGQEALDALKKDTYDLIFMDCHMPGMDGFETTRTIRQDGVGIVNPQAPIIAMTANAVEGAREECLEAGMDDYIAKPITPETVARTIQKWLPL